MAGKFRSALDDCLASMGRGESLQACLARYPRHARQLRPLLLLGQRLRHTPHHPPAPAANAIAWRRFRQRAHELRMARAGRPGFGWLRPLAIAASLLIAFLAAGGGAVYAAQDSLPDGPLYRVKLASEQARLWFVFDDTDKADILLDQSQERTQEIQAMLQKEKPIPGSTLAALHNRSSRALRILENHPDEIGLLTRAREQAAAQEQLLLALWVDVSPNARDDYAQAVATLHNAQLRIASDVAAVISPDDLAGGVLVISGTADPSFQDLWLVGGVELRIDERTLGSRDLKPGDTARLVAARGPNGRLQALSLDTSQTRQPQQDIIVAGAIDELTDDEVRIGDQSFAITSSTLLRLKLQRGRRVQITANSVDGRTIASAVKSAPIQEEATASPSLSYEGTIQGDAPTSGETNDWLVGGQRFLISSATEIDAQAGQVASGSRVRIDAVNQAGRLVANRVTILAAKPNPDSINLEGAVQGTTASTWRIAGLDVTPPPNEKPAAQGTVIRVEATRRAEQLQAIAVFTLFLPDDDLVQIQGIISRIQDETWRLGNAQVRIDDDSLIFGSPLEGARALAWGSRKGDGPLHAVYINILDERPLNPPPEED